MVVDDLDIIRVPLVPSKADPVPVVDADTMTGCPVAPQRFKAVAGRYQQVAEPSRTVQRHEPAKSDRFYVDEPGHPLAAEQPFRVAAAERLDHRFQNITFYVLRQA